MRKLRDVFWDNETSNEAELIMERRSFMNDAAWDFNVEICGFTLTSALREIASLHVLLRAAVARIEKLESQKTDETPCAS